MKHLFIFVLLFSSLGCSDSYTAPLQERVLSEQAVAYLETTAQSLKYDVERCAEHGGGQKNEHFLGSTSDLGWGYSIRFTSEEGEGVSLMDDFFSHLLRELAAVGAYVDSQEQFESTNEMSRFKIDYSKGAITGSISAVYRVGGEGRHIVEIDQTEKQ